MPWSAELWQKLLSLHPLPSNMIIQNNAKPLSRYQVSFEKAPLVSIETEETKIESLKKNWTTPVYNENNPYIAKIKSNQRITSEDWEQDVRHIVLEIDQSQITYNPGDVVYIKPTNPVSQVTKFIEFFQLNPNQLIFSIKKQHPDYSDINIPLPISVFDLCKDFFDFLGTPNRYFLVVTNRFLSNFFHSFRYFFELLSHFATENREIEQLKLLSSAQGYELFYDYCRKPKRTYLDIFADFPSARPPLGFFSL